MLNKFLHSNKYRPRDFHGAEFSKSQRSGIGALDLVGVERSGGHECKATCRALRNTKMYFDSARHLGGGWLSDLWAVRHLGGGWLSDLWAWFKVLEGRITTTKAGHWVAAARGLATNEIGGVIRFNRLPRISRSTPAVQS